MILLAIVISLLVFPSAWGVDVLQDAHAAVENSLLSYNKAETKFLEASHGEHALAWACERTGITKAYLQQQSSYAAIHQTIQDICYDKRKLPFGSLHKGYVENFWTDEQNPLGLWRRTTLVDYACDDPTWDVILDVDRLSAQMGEKIVFRGCSRSHLDDNRMLVQFSFGGRDEENFQEWDMEKRQFVEGGFSSKNMQGLWIGSKLTKVHWVDHDTVLVTIALDEKDGLTHSRYPRSVFLWKRGMPLETAKKIFEIASDDVLTFVTPLFERAAQPRLFCLIAMHDFYTSDYYLFDPSDVAGNLQKLLVPNDIEHMGSFKDQVYFCLRSPWSVGRGFDAGSVVALHWKDLFKADDDKNVHALFVPQQALTCDGIVTTKNEIFISVLDSLNTKLFTCTLNEQGRWQALQEVTLPADWGSISIQATEDEELALMTFSTVLMPPRIYLWQDKTFVPIKQSTHFFASDDYVYEQRWAVSKDGTQVPYFIAYKKGMQLDGNNPTLLTAYGGFQMINLPTHSRIRNEVWLAHGGVYVVANIRGGGEFGPAWHKAAILDKRQNAFDDFYAVAQALIAEGITAPDHLSICGGSNGGLLVTVAMTQHPELFKSVACLVPILDMMRYTEFGAGHSWIAEYGDPSDARMRAYIKGYAPLEQLRSDVSYPLLLLTDSVEDQRVHPWHARIMHYMMEQHPHAVSYLLESQDAGHGAGASLTDMIDSWTYQWVFHAATVGLTIEG